MLFNYDLFEIVAVAFVVSGILTYSFYKSSPINNESLVNTNSLSNLDSNIQLNNLTSHVDAVVQTEVNIPVEATTYINTGMQTSSRMWYESIRNWINEILGTGTTPNPNYVDVGVQTGTRSSWELFKESLNKFFDFETGSVSTPNQVRIDTWMSSLESTQSVDLNNSESSLTNLRFGSESELQNLVDPNDSAI